MELIPQWKQAYKFTSVILLALLGLFDILYATLPDLKALMPATTFAVVNTVASYLAIFFRVVRQNVSVPAEVKAEVVANAKDLPVTK